MNKNIKIGIIGLGLIGGCLALKLNQENWNVLGFTRNFQNCKNTKFPVYSSFDELKNCQVIFICTPLSEILNTLETIQEFINPDSLVTDVGSVKKFIDKKAKEITKIKFIGGHPMAGTEKSGFSNAFPELFENRPWVLLEKNELLENIIKSTGAKIYFTDAESHDIAVSLISHLPLLLSQKLLNTVENYPDKNIRELALNLASSGFESMTRLARGNQQLNHDLLSFNEKNVKNAFNLFLNGKS